jgi:hypothetical protein
MIAAVVLGIMALLTGGCVVVRVLAWLAQDPSSHITPLDWDDRAWRQYRRRHGLDPHRW